MARIWKTLCYERYNKYERWKKEWHQQPFRDEVTENFEHDAHTLECVFHVNEIYLSHMIKEIEGKSAGRHALGDGALLNKIKSIINNNPQNLVD